MCCFSSEQLLIICLLLWTLVYDTFIGQYSTALLALVDRARCRIDKRKGSARSTDERVGKRALRATWDKTDIFQFINDSWEVGIFHGRINLTGGLFSLFPGQGKMSLSRFSLKDFLNRWLVESRLLPGEVGRRGNSNGRRFKECLRIFLFHE